MVVLCVHYRSHEETKRNIQEAIQSDEDWQI